jgi:all-trans-retinol dehydrogenase (NAD+)
MTVVCSGLIQTDMFAGVRIRFPFLTPPLRVNEIVDEVVDALVRRTRDEIWLPWAAYVILFMRWLPVSLADRIQQVKNNLQSPYIFLLL